MPRHAGDGPGVDDGATAAVADQRCGCLDTQKRPGQVHRDDPVPVVQRGIGDPPATQCHPGVVDQDVERAVVRAIPSMTCCQLS